jgi:hypothetical protein
MISIVMLLILPTISANQLVQGSEHMDNLAVTLYDNADRMFTVGEERYAISGTNALSAFLVAAEQEEYSYQISDEYYEQFSSFLITSINGIENQGMDGWQFWVNYPQDEIPMVGANDYELTEGDVVSWFYGGYGVNPETSDHVITIEISIDTDETNPSLSLTKPNDGDIYLNNNLLFTIPFMYISVIIKSIELIAEATDEESGIETVSFAIDGTTQYTDYTQPYTWEYAPSSGFKKTRLTVTATDRSNHQHILDQSLLFIG